MTSWCNLCSQNGNQKVHFQWVNQDFDISVLCGFSNVCWVKYIGWVSELPELSHVHQKRRKLVKPAGRALGFVPRGPGFKSCLFQLFWKWYWVVTPVVASPYQGVKLGQIYAWKFRVNSEDHYVQARAECRQWWIHPGLETHGQSQPKSGNRECQWLHKMVTCHRKNLIKKETASFRLCKLICLSESISVFLYY